MVTARYQLTADDFFACLALHNPRLASERRNALGLSTLLTAVGLASVLCGADAWGALALGWGGMMLVFLLAYHGKVKSEITRQWSQMDAIEMTFVASGVSGTKRAMACEISWARFRHVREGAEHFLLYEAADLYTIIPKRGFSSDAGVATFRGLVSQVGRA